MARRVLDVRAPTLIVLAALVLVALVLGPDIVGALTGALDGFTVGA